MSIQFEIRGRSWEQARESMNLSRDAQECAVGSETSGRIPENILATFKEPWNTLM
jgi:hypothetical protein